MLAYSVNMDSFLNEFITMIKSVIVKQSTKAALYETADTKRDGDRYIAMCDGSVNWSSIMRFDREVLLAAGVGESIVDELYSNKELIPVNLRSLCVELQIKKVISEYVEKNNYYRMLHGEPNIEDTEEDFVYMYENDRGIRTDIPVHQLPFSEQNYINSSGIDKELYARHPTKEYLKHLGNRAVSYYNARIALNYSILYIEKSNIESLNINFGKYYANARNYVMRGLYHNEDRAMFESYDSFMGFNIMVMAINRLIASIFTQGITREFYDDDLIRTLYECYNIPYEESIAVKYHRELAKRLNVFLQYKSSKHVIFDVIGLFNYRNVTVYEYYLVKDVKKDEHGDPLFIYKTVVDEEGNSKTVIDPEKTYNIYFQKVSIDSEDPTLELANTTNTLPYETITAEDPYWIDDSDLLNKIYNTKFNSIATKYMSFDVAFDLAKIMYETCHSFRMILEKHPECKKIMVKTPYSSEDLSLFDIIIFTNALIAKKFTLTGEVPLKPWNIAQVYGFNFQTDLEILKDDILEQIEANHGEFSEVDPNILQFIKSRTLRTVDDVEEMFKDIENLRVFIDTAMRYTTNLNAYRAYQKIYKALLITTDYADIYTKFDGTLATTYLELLEDRHPELVPFVTGDADMSIIATQFNGNNDENDVNTKINRMLDVISNISDELEHIQYANAKNEMVNNLEKVINQFKSYTVDMQDSGIIYVINDPHLCMLKILDWISMHDIRVKYETDMFIEDVLAQILVKRYFSDDIPVRSKEQMFLYSLIRIKDYLRLWYKLKMNAHEYIKDETDLTDTITSVFNEYVLPKLKMKISDDIPWVEGKMEFKDIIKLPDDIWKVFVDMCFNDETFVIDSMKERAALSYLMGMSIKDQVFREIRYDFKDIIEFVHKIKEIEVDEDFDMNIDTIDTIIVDKNMTIEDKYLKITDWLKTFYFLHQDDIIKLMDEYKFLDSLSIKNEPIDFVDSFTVATKDVYHSLNIGTPSVLKMNIDMLIQPNVGDNTLEANALKGDSISIKDSLKIIYE